MELDEAKQAVLDQVLTSYADEIRSNPAHVTSEATLRYTHSLHRSWRIALRMLPIDPSWSILDVGCGLGVLSFELAANLPLSVYGVDIQPEFVAHAEEILARLDGKGLFVPGGHIRFGEGDIFDLPVPDRSIDLVFVRELLQFLPEPAPAVSELFRVLKPGGYACISDTDDQLYITWPPPPDSQTRLVEAFTSQHRRNGGDRQTGRKLSTYLSNAGFEIASTVVLPEAQHRIVDGDDVERALIVNQLKAARERMVASETITGAEFDSLMAELEAESPRAEFRMNARIIALGRKPLTG